MRSPEGAVIFCMVCQSKLSFCFVIFLMALFESFFLLRLILAELENNYCNRHTHTQYLTIMPCTAGSIKCVYNSLETTPSV